VNAGRRPAHIPTEAFMFQRLTRQLRAAAIFGHALVLCVPLSMMSPAWAAESSSGVVTVRSAYPMVETIARLKKDIADKGIKFFDEIDQTALAAGAGIKLQPSTLLIFGNPPLGIQFLTANPDAGLDWPVRLLVRQDSAGQVWVAYTDFAWIAHRHAIHDRDAQFAKATEVIASITSAVAAK
jgi:uncharacterized protein (DUF302 family)